MPFYKIVEQYYSIYLPIGKTETVVNKKKVRCNRLLMKNNLNTFLKVFISFTEEIIFSPVYPIVMST